MGQHKNRVKDQIRKSDIENRILCLNYDWEKQNYVNRLVEIDNKNAVYKEDICYQKMIFAWKNREEVWTKLRKKKKFSYENNSKQNPQAIKHKRIFSLYLEKKFRDFENRKIGEEEDNLILNSQEKWEEKIYNDSKKYFENDNLRKKELLSKANLTEHYEPFFRMAIFNPNMKEQLKEKLKGNLSNAEINELCLRASSL